MINNSANMIKFTSKVKQTIDDVDAGFIKRHNVGKYTNKLNFKNTLYASTNIIHTTSIDNVVSTLEIDTNLVVSKNSIIKKRNTDHCHLSFKKLNDTILDYIYEPVNEILEPYDFEIDFDKKSYKFKDLNPKCKEAKNKKNKCEKLDSKKLFINNTKYVFVACDGCQINVCAELINDIDIKRSSNGQYGVCNLSCLHDVINNIPITNCPTGCPITDLHKMKVSEINGFLQQLPYLADKTTKYIIIFDRGYYCKKLFKALNKNSIGYIFRMKSDSKLFKGMYNGKSKIVDLDGSDVQLFKYKIKEEEYYIMTSITENISISEIKALYWKRWGIETNNRRFKYDVLCNNIRSKTYNSFLVDLESIRFITLTASIIEYLGRNKDTHNTYKINSKNCLEKLYSKLLLSLIFNSHSNDSSNTHFCNIVGIICKSVTKIVKGRSYNRVRKSPKTKWVYTNKNSDD